MKTFICCDIEGVNGICSWSETKKGTSEYDYFSKRMTDEIDWICRGINNFNSDTNIYIRDAHDSARNIDHFCLPKNTYLLRGWSGNPYCMMQGIDKSFDATILSGCHSGAGTNHNPLSHTMSQNIVYLKINGILANEFLINYYASLYNEVPVVMVSGDAGLCNFAKKLDPNIFTVTTLSSDGGSVVSEHPINTFKKLEEAAFDAINSRNKMSIDLPKKFEIEIYYKNYVTAYRHSFYPNAYEISANIVGFKCDDYFEFLRFFSFQPD